MFAPSIMILTVLVAHCQAHDRADNPFADVDPDSHRRESGYPTHNDMIYHKREHSLLKPYTVSFWDYLGSTLVTPSYVRLTSDTKSQEGSAWNMIPVKLVNWEMHVNFKVTGSTKSLFGDGMVFWYVKDRMKKGSVFGSADHFSGLAVVLDTYSNSNGPHNHEHPYISAMINNGSKSYDHDKDGTHTMLGTGCHAKFRNKKHDTILAVRYEADTLTVSVDVKGDGVFEVCMRETGVILPTGYYFGFSASTGDLSDNHDLISVVVFDVDSESGDGKADARTTVSRDHLIPTAREESQDAVRAHVADDPSQAPMSKWRILFYVFGFAVVALVLAGGGFWYYRTNHDMRRKRFY